MDIRTALKEHFVRVLAALCLALALADAGRLLGVSSGSASPLALLGTVGFILLAVFTLARLFAAVGLWIESSWGGVLLAGATIIELVLLFAGVGLPDISLIGMLVRMVLFVGIIGFLALRYLHRREQIHA